MFERATDDIIMLATVAAAAVLAVFAGGFALYAAFLPSVGSAWAAAIVAAVAAVVVGIFALVAVLRNRMKERAAAMAQAELSRSMPAGIGDLARDHPIAALAASLIGGALAARHPKLARDVISLVARFGAQAR